MMKKRLLALGLLLALICSFAGCQSKENVENKTSTEPAESKAEESLVGTWVVVKTEVYDTSLKAMTEQITNTYFYVGSEHEFTADGVYKNADGTLTTNYSVIDKNHLTMTEVGGGNAILYDYELNGDEYVQYGNYTDTSGHVTHSNAVYFKRK